VNARANSGDHLALVRLAFSVAGTAGIRNRVATTGYNISSGVNVDQSVATSLTAPTSATSVDTGIITLPSCALPTGTDGDGYTVAHNLLLTNTGGGTCTTSSVTRIPLDYAAVLARYSFSAATGLLYDGDTDSVFLADVNGAGAPLLSVASIVHPLRAAPGATTRVVVGTVGANAGAFDVLSYRTRPRFLTATG
jgi:hypothetical protein